MSVYSILSDELKAKLRNCRTEEELKNVLAQENIELDPEMLEAVSGGGYGWILKEEGASLTCPPILREKAANGSPCPPYHVF